MGQVDYDKVGEVYDSSDEEQPSPLDICRNELNIAIKALNWYSKHGYAQETDLRGIAQEALREIYKRKET